MTTFTVTEKQKFTRADCTTTEAIATSDIGEIIAITGGERFNTGDEIHLSENGEISVDGVIVKAYVFIKLIVHQSKQGGYLVKNGDRKFYWFESKLWREVPDDHELDDCELTALTFLHALLGDHRQAELLRLSLGDSLYHRKFFDAIYLRLTSGIHYLPQGVEATEKIVYSHVINSKNLTDL